MFEKLKENEELWDLFTRKEEYSVTFRDGYERFPYYLSNHRSIFEPRVSKFLVENGLKPQYPDEKNLQSASHTRWEVGLHGGHESYNSLEDIKEKKRRLEEVLGRKVIGYRNHYLRFRVPDTWELLSKAGFKYDTTLGYSDCAGFRNGMCHPFRPFNLNEGYQIDIMEIPLVIMDRSLLRDYMRLSVKKAWECTKHLINTVEKYNGVITILWHNNTCIEGENLKYYEKVLEYCAGKNAWITSGEEIYNWWTSKIEPGI